MRRSAKAWVLGLAMVWTGGCVDPEPVIVERKDKATASPECLKCLASPSDPGPGCGDQLAACKAASTCSRGYDCTFQQGCVGDTVQRFVECLPGCATLAGFGAPDDPGRIAGLRIFECMTRGPCSVSCFTDATDGGGIPDDAADVSTPPDAPIGSDSTAEGGGGACVNPSDEAIASDSMKVEAAARTCGTQCFGQAADCNAACMEMQAGFSKDCAKCWGDSVNCGAANCLVPCLSGSANPECRACTDIACAPAFRACAGTAR